MIHHFPQATNSTCEERDLLKVSTQLEDVLLTMLDRSVSMIEQ